MGRVAKRTAAVIASVWCLWWAAGRQIDRSPWITAFAQVPACGANPVVCENQQTGDTDFDAPGDPLIEGFATDISVNTGQAIGFKINTVSTNYQIAIYRLGFYGGAGARKITTLGPFTQPQSQPDCLTDSASGLISDSPTGLADCSNWSVTTSWNTTGATSGIYLAKLTRLDVTPQTSSHIVFVVRDDARNAEIVLQTSDTTWQAYNQWGGGSLYCGGPVSNAGTAYRCPGRAVKVSYNRPMDTRAHDPQSFLFNAEYPMVRWLEANGYDVKYWSGVDTDRFGAELTGVHKPKAFLSVGHDEYWSANQRKRVEDARNAGVNLAFFSGNEMFWKTRWEPSRDSAQTPYRTLVSYKETLRNTTNNDPLDPLDTGATPVSTATWRDTRFGPPADGGRPENALTGQFWTVNCCSSDITVPAEMSALRFWRNTRIASLTANTVATLSAESLGYEWDEDLDNGSRPAGLVHLSSTTRSVAEKILDFGTAVGPGTATHSLTLYRHPSDAIIFGAGTVQWSWGLDGQHDRGDLPGSHLPDQAMQQATINLLADMNVQPATLQIGADPNRPLVRGVKSTDIVGPTSSITAPVSGSTVRAGARVVITGTAADSGGTVAGVEVSVDGGSTWKQAQGTTSWVLNWSPTTVGPTTIRARAIDDSGNLEAAGPSITIGVEPGNCPCTSIWPASTTPPIPDFNDATALELGVKFKSDIDGFITGVRYYKSAGNSGTHIGNLWTIGGTRLATATFSGETTSGWQQVNFASPVPITANTVYIASYHTDTGHYAASSDYFASASVDSPPLHALTSIDAGGNGVFLPSITSGFPNQSFRSTNYWVDVVFSPTIQDTTPPVIFDVEETTIDSANATITWTTDESATSRVEYSTDVTFPTASTLMVSSGTFVTAHQLTLTRLTPNTTYFYRVTSVDRAGNSASFIAPSFTVPGPTLRDTALADFDAGQDTGTYAAQTGNGELILAPAAGSEFAGSALPAGWSAVQWNIGGTATVGNGVVAVDGARVGVCAYDANGLCTIEAPQYGPGHSLEFVAQFSGDTFEHAGFGITLGSVTEPWAVFSTFSGGGLYARTNTGVTSVDQLLAGNFIGTPHRYRIDWNADGSVTYFIDGVQVAAHAAKILSNMRPVAGSDLTTGGGKVIVDWTRMTPYAASGTFLSRVFDAEASVFWNSIQWTAQTPVGTSVAISVRAGDSATPDATWTAFAPVPGPGTLTQHSRYIQYRADLKSNNSGVTPSLDDIIISTSHAPTPQPDSASVQMNGSLVFPATGTGSLTANDTDVDPNDVLRIIRVTQPAHGATLLNGDRSVTYAPTLNYQGPDSFVYTVSDGLLTATATVSITVRGANVAPVANPDAYTLDEDTTLTVSAVAGVLANDTDADRNTLTAMLVAPPAHGMLALGSNGSFTYTPEPNYAGSDAFTYKANDGTDNSNVAAVQFTINQVNDPPITEPDTFVTTMNQTLTIAAPGVLRNDHDVEVEDTAPLRTVIGSTANAHGTVTLGSDGGFTYVPETDFVGSASFSYSAVDHFGAVGNLATVTINVQIEAVSQQSASGGTVSTGTAVTADDPLQTAVTTPTAATVTIGQGVLSSASLPSSYTFLNRQVNVTVINPDGTEFAGSITNPLTLAFTIDASLIPAGQSAATLQIFRDNVLVPDCLGATTIPSAQRDPCITRRDTGVNGSALISLLSSHASKWNMGVASTDPTPVARDDGSYFTAFAAPLVIPGPGVLGNDYGRTPLHASVTGTATGGTVVLAASGGFTFTPSPGFCGAASFTYVATDDNSLKSNTGTATVRVNCQPVAVNDSFSVLEDSGSSALTVVANDSDPDDGQAALRITAVTSAAHGTVTIASGATWVNYQPEANYFGTDTFTYTITDGRGGKATGTVTVTVKPVDDAPSFVKGADQTVLEDSGAKTVAGWATSISAGPANESTQALNFIVTTNNDALFSAAPAVASNGTLTFTPAANANGSAIVTVSLHDNGTTIDGGVDTSAAQTFVITVTAVNDAPAFVKGADQTVLEDSGPKTVTAWATSISAGGADESAQQLSFIVTNSNNTLFSAQPAIAANGTLTFTPAPNANGSATVTVKLQDTGGIANGGADTSAAQTFTITVTPVNDAPSFVKGLDQTVLEDAGAQVVSAWATSISAGAPDESAQVLTFTVTNNNNALFSAQPAVAANGTLTYTPAPNANGSAVVTVTLKDDGGIANAGVNTSTAQTFNIKVTAVNDAPVASDQTVTTPEDTAKAITLAAKDVDGDALTYTVVTAPAHGTLSGTAPALTYTPAANYNGTDSFTFTASDPSNTGSNVATVSITITAVNDPPVAVADSKSVRQDRTLTFPVTDLTVNDSPGPADESSQTLTVTGVSITTNGTVSLINGTVTFTPAATGPASFGYTVCDNGTTNGVADRKCASGTVNVTVLPPNVAPTVGAITWTSPTSVDGVKVGTVVSPTATFTDTAGDTHTAVWAWGDGTTSAGTVNETTGGVTGSHTYTTPKLYTVTLTVTDGDGASGSSVFQYVAVFNPAAGTEAGSGSISSPAGSFTANPSLAGTANINVNTQYLLGPLGGAFQFSYTAAGMTLQTTSLRWLVKSGSQSWLKGEGTSTVNGVSEVCYFLVSVVDSTTVADKVRVKIWNKATGKVIYDNQKSAGVSPPDDAVATVAAPTGPSTITFR